VTLLDSLLDAILRLDGEALVMHTGEKPYVVLTSKSKSTVRGPLAWGQVELSSRPLTADAVIGMLGQMLSSEQSHTLDELGAIEQEIDAPGDSGERFVVTAARGGHDVWVEVRRRSKVVEAPAAAPVEELPAAVAAPPQPGAPAEPEPAMHAEAENVQAGVAPEPASVAESAIALVVDGVPEIHALDDDVHEISTIEEDLTAIVDETGGSDQVFEIASMPGFGIQTEASRLTDEDEHRAGVFEIEADSDSLLELESDSAPVFEIARRATPVPPRHDAPHAADVGRDAVPDVDTSAEISAVEISHALSSVVQPAAQEPEIWPQETAHVAPPPERVPREPEPITQETEPVASAPAVVEYAAEPASVERKIDQIAQEFVAEIAGQKVAEAAEQKVGEIAAHTVAQVADHQVSEIAERRVAEIAERTVAEVAEQKVGEIAARSVTEAAEQRVGAIAQQTVGDVAEQRVAAVAEPTVTRIAAERVAAIAGQIVTVAAHQQVAEIAGVTVTEAAQQKVGEIADQKVAEIAAQRVAAIAEQTVTDVAHQQVAEIAELKVAELAEQKIAEIAQQKAAEIAQKVAEIAAQTVPAAAEETRAAEPEAPAAHGRPEWEPVSVVVPHARPAFKLYQPPPPSAAPSASEEASLVELLRAAAAQRASTVYAVVDLRPMMRVEGHISLVGTHPSVAAGDVERFTFEFAPRDQLADAAPEWTCSVPGVGRVRCVTFHDHSGAGLIFHLPDVDASAADELGIPAELHALCSEADGLIVVAGPRSSGKSMLLSAFVDLINRTRYDHVITIESQIRKVHEKRLSFVSQREVRGDGDAIAAAARAALREGPDVLVIEDLRAPEALTAALDAARAGRLVFGSISAPTAPAAVQRLIDAFPADRRPQVRASLAGSLRAVIAQLLVPRAAGGRIAAREVLLSSPAVRKLVLDGAIEQLPIAIESGRNLGMRTIVDSLGALVREGVVDIGDACACAPDRGALISALQRDGIDVTGVERRA
jgi:twitching motility protein PilT